ncbi:hypothetical protein KAI87_16420 [Myxococcota bacterium]|nr:hypothetical protein [Myxococcota bacterium]
MTIKNLVFIILALGFTACATQKQAPQACEKSKKTETTEEAKKGPSLEGDYRPVKLPTDPVEVLDVDEAKKQSEEKKTEGEKAE